MEQPELVKKGVRDFFKNQFSKKLAHRPSFGQNFTSKKLLEEENRMLTTRFLKKKVKLQFGIVKAKRAPILVDLTSGS